MRKIAANYIYLPGYPLIKNGYVLLDGGKVTDVVDTGGEIREIQGLEFYGGMLVAGFLAGKRFDFPDSGSLVAYLETLYREERAAWTGLCLMKGADLLHLQFRPGILLERLG